MIVPSFKKSYVFLNLVKQNLKVLFKSFMKVKA